MREWAEEKRKYDAEVDAEAARLIRGSGCAPYEALRIAQDIIARMRRERAGREDARYPKPWMKP